MIDRRKCLLLTHTGTVILGLRAGIRSADLRPPGLYLVGAIETELRAEHLSPDTFGRLQPVKAQVAMTASRSMLGFMNQMTLEIRYQVSRHGGLPACDVDDLNHYLRRSLRNRDGYVRPIDLV